MPARTHSVAVITPVYRARFTPDEETSFRHLARHLGAYDKILVAPRTLDVEREGFAIRRFDDAYFRSPQSYSALLLSERFYRAFADYEFILIYQLDALVFSDQLRDWCAKGYDYIGAPWFPCAYTPHIQTAKVGNGGLSLRRVESAIRVLRSPALGREYYVDPAAYWQATYAGRPLAERLANLPRKYLKRLHALNSPRYMLAHALRFQSYIEDEFWANEASKYDPAFCVAPLEEGARFAAEAEPRRCVAMNGGELPFGCHAWDRIDRAFWEPHLEPEAPRPASRHAYAAGSVQVLAAAGAGVDPVFGSATWPVGVSA